MRCTGWPWIVRRGQKPVGDILLTFRSYSQRSFINFGSLVEFLVFWQEEVLYVNVDFCGDANQFFTVIF